MATPEEIRRRVEQADTARCAARSAAAQQVGELAQRRAGIVEQLDEVERQLGDVLVVAQEVIGIDELVQFTDVPAADLTRWLTARTSARAKRKRPGADAAHSETRRKPAGARAGSARQAAAVPEPAVPPVGAADTSARVTAEVA